MQKTKLIVSLFVSLLLCLGILVMPAYASAPTISIQKLPGYINENSFQLSCSFLGGSSAQFYVSKHGGAFSAFGSAIDLTSNPCRVQVTSTQVNDQTDYTFKVSLDGGSATDTTSTIYDTNGPSNVYNYSKEFVIYGFNKVHFRTPSDSDFDRTVIYRSDTLGFSADGSHEIARISGLPNSDMTYEDHFSYEQGKNYYYLLRALDKAGNSSGLVGDGGGTVQASPIPAGAGTGTSGSAKVVTLPKESTSGEVLPLETEAPFASISPETVGTQGQEFGLSSFLSSTRGKLLAGLGVLGIGALLYFFSKRK